MQLSGLPESTLLSLNGPQPVSFSYVNYKGVFKRRKAILQAVYWGSNKWHSKDQWLVIGWDLEKQEERTYALKDIMDVRPMPKSEVPGV